MPAGVRPIGMTMSVNGRFPQLFQILRSLELQNRFTTVDNVSLQTQGDAGTGGGGTLGSTLGLTVYTFDASGAASPLTRRLRQRARRPPPLPLHRPLEARNHEPFSH
ncbi:GspMb/PilO family protein [Deinococcus sp. PESE-38]